MSPSMWTKAWLPAAIFGGAAVLGLWLSDLSVIPFVLALLSVALTLFLPGYAIVRLAMRPVHFRLLHVVLAVGISMAVTVFGGFLLHLVRTMTPLGWADLLGGITLIAFAASLRSSPWSIRGHALPRALAEVSRGQALIFACSLATTVGAFLIACQGSAAHKEFLATEFWMVPERGCCPNALALGIRNLEGVRAKYEVEIMLEGQIVGSWRSITLEPDQTWISEANLRFQPGSGRRAEAWLFKNQDHRTIYRRVWADVGRT